MLDTTPPPPTRPPPHTGDQTHSFANARQALPLRCTLSSGHPWKWSAISGRRRESLLVGMERKGWVRDVTLKT